MYQLHPGDCLTLLKTLDPNTVQTCITSPPYWQLKDYQAQGQVGDEDTPELFVIKMTEIFAEVRRVLKPDGTLWLNIGDTYIGGGYSPNAPSNRKGSKQSHASKERNRRPYPPGYKPKDLVGIPWMTALALRQNGWYLRTDIIWDKTNGMPEKVVDRPTRTHEYLFLLSKSRRYYYDHLAVHEGKRNLRAVWRIPKKNVPGHHAVFPERLVELCVLAGSKPGDTVLDIFAGSGTTGIVALNHNRHFVGCEINDGFYRLALDRLKTARQT